MDKQAWLLIKQDQVKLYRKRAASHAMKRGLLALLYIPGFISAVILPLVMLSNRQYLLALAVLVLFPVSYMIWKLSTYQNRAKQLLTQLDNAIMAVIRRDQSLKSMRAQTTEIETRFLSNDDELFVKKFLWKHFLAYKEEKKDEQIRYERAVAEYERLRFTLTFQTKPWKRPVFVQPVVVGPVWNTETPHRQGYKDSNTISDEWAIVKAFRRMFFATKFEIHGILDETSKVAQQNPVVFERFLRKKKVSKKMKWFKLRAWVHYLSPAAKMRLVTFVEQVLVLEPTEFNDSTATLLHEKNEQIKKYTADFWQVHWRSVKYYWFEALWLLLLIPFIGGAANLIGNGAIIEGAALFTVGASLVAFGEMALVVRQRIKLNGKKLIPPLIASLIGSRHAMCATTQTDASIQEYRRRFKNLEKHFIMTTPEIDSVKYVKENLRDEERTSKLHEADAICDQAETRMAMYYRMFHLYRRRCLQYGCLEMFMAIMLLPVWGAVFAGIYMMGPYSVYAGADIFVAILVTATVICFEVVAVLRHIRVWRFKEMYFKIYQALSVLTVDGDLRSDPNKLKSQFEDVERSAIVALNNDQAMRPMVETLARVSGLEFPKRRTAHALDNAIHRVRMNQVAEDNKNNVHRIFR